jgi:3-oxoadipate enol-lactonase
MMERPDSTAVIENLVKPLLIVAGEEDALIPLDESKKMQAASANGELVVLPRAGHLVNLEDPTAFNDSLQRFLGRL